MPRDKDDFETCPYCGLKTLEVDDEYMSDAYGDHYPRNPKKWTYFCTNEECGQANPLDMMLADVALMDKKQADIQKGIEKALKSPDKKGDAPNPTFIREQWDLPHGVTVMRFTDKAGNVLPSYEVKVGRNAARNARREEVELLFRLAGRHEKRAE